MTQIRQLFRISTRLCFAAGIVAVLSFRSTAQISVLDTKKLDQIKNGQTYVLVKNVNFPGAAEYLNVLKNSWFLTKGIQYMPVDKLDKVSPDDSYLSLEALTETKGYVTNIYYYLSFWTWDEKALEKKGKVKESDQEPIAKISLSVDQKAFATPKFFKTMDFDGGGLLYNWSPGMLKNYLQQLSVYITEKRKIKIQDEIIDKEELSELSKETLYVADFNLIRFSPFMGQKKTPEDRENIFEHYKYKYEVVTKNQLNKLIVETGKPLYYLTFIKDSSSKIVCVTNAQTGKTIYSRATSLSYNLKPGDLKDLNKEIN